MHYLCPCFTGSLLVDNSVMCGNESSRGKEYILVGALLAAKNGRIIFLPNGPDRVQACGCRKSVTVDGWSEQQMQNFIEINLNITRFLEMICYVIIIIIY